MVEWNCYQATCQFASILSLALSLSLFPLFLHLRPVATGVIIYCRQDTLSPRGHTFTVIWQGLIFKATLGTLKACFYKFSVFVLLGNSIGGVDCRQLCGCAPMQNWIIFIFNSEFKLILKTSLSMGRNSLLDVYCYSSITHSKIILCTCFLHVSDGIIYSKGLISYWE